MREFDEAGGRLAHEEVDVGLLEGEAQRGVRGFVEVILRDAEHAPLGRTLRGGIPGHLALERADVEVHGGVRVRPAVLHRTRHREAERAGRQRQFRVRAGGHVRDGDQHAARLPFGMALQRLVARRAGGIAVLVVEPQRHPRRLRLLHHVAQRVPVSRRVEIVRAEADVARHAAEAVEHEVPQFGVVRLAVVGPTVVERQDTGRRGRVRETRRTAAALRRRLGQRIGDRDASHAARREEERTFDFHAA